LHPAVSCLLRITLHYTSKSYLCIETCPGLTTCLISIGNVSAAAGATPVSSSVVAGSDSEGGWDAAVLLVPCDTSVDGEEEVELIAPALLGGDPRLPSDKGWWVTTVFLNH
jgi:hypothetical protein